MKKILPLRLFLFSMFILFLAGVASAQVTTSSISGVVHDNEGNPLPAATVMAVHNPSGTTYGTTTREDGRFALPGMRVGGPYSVTVSFVGYQKQTREDIHLTLGVARNVDFVLHDENIKLNEITITGERDAIFSAERTGAATSINLETIQALPTITRRIDDFVRLTPQAKRTPFGGFYFAGQDNRLNNITIDGSYFNNSFGLGGQPGDRTGVAPISLDAIEQVQVNVAPFDVRQGNFVGAGINTVTKSGTNEYSGSVYYQFRNESLVGKKAKDLDVDPGKFNYKQIGVNVGGPIIRNKLFFFASFENDALTQPGTTYLANPGGVTPGGNITRVPAATLNELSAFLKNNFGYVTGPYQGYDHEIPATRFLFRLDYNLDQRNKISLRYTHLDSETDVLLSNSSSLGNGNRRSSTDALNFQNSNYKILENIRSIVGEWNSTIGTNLSNNLIVGYTYNDESRDSRGSMFPFIDILESGSTFTSFGFEPFTPNNELRYKSFQIQDNLSYYLTDHYLTFGISAERYESENVFFPGSQSVYVYNSLADFYADANAYLANPNRTASDVTLKKFQVRWSNQPGMEKPVQPLEVWYTGIYGQDEWHLLDNLRLTGGIRIDVPFFGETGFVNAEVDGMNFKDENGNTVKYSTSKLPDPNPLFSPRIGFNWDIFKNQTTQLRGGTGIFTSRPAYVWISNQIGNNGVLTGFEQKDNTTERPFNPNPDHYKPASVSGDPAASYELAFTDPDFKFPQLWRTNLAVDQKLPFGLIGTVEFLYNKDVNGIYYINANLADPVGTFNGVDNRLKWDSKKNRINSKISSAIVLKNQDQGYTWNLSASLEKPFSSGLYAKLAYSFGEAKNTVDPGSIAYGSWNSNQHSSNPNNPGLGFSAATQGHRILAALSYRKEYFNFGGTTISLFLDGSSPFNGSYTYSGDLNGDGGSSNDLIYIPKDKSEMNFQEYTDKNGTYTAAQQADAWEAYIEQDDYLKENRGKYAERNGARLPMVFRLDLSLVQEVFAEFIGYRNTLQFRVDFLNFTNLLNKNWGVSDRFFGGNTQPLVSKGADAAGNVTYTMKNVGGQLLTKSIESAADIADVFSIQIGIRYIFN